MKISELGLSRRATNCLYRAGIATVEELRQKRTWELQSIRSFGAKSLREVQEALERLEDSKPKTNADRIRAMSDEELAAFLCDRIANCTAQYCPGVETCGTEVGKGDGLKRWLQQPAEEG